MPAPSRAQTARSHRAVLLIIGGVLTFAAGKLYRDRPREVVIVAVKRETLRATLNASGFVESFQARIAPQVSGRLVETYVNEQDRVKAGQVLGRLDVTTVTAEAKAAQSAVATAAAQSQGAQHAVASMQRQAPGAIGQAQAALEAAQEQLRKLERGSRPEEIATADANVQQANAALVTARAQLARALTALEQQQAVSDTMVREAQALLEAAQANERRVLAGARPQELAQAEANLADARSRASFAQKELARMERLFQGGASSQQQVDSARTSATSAREAENAVREQLALLRAGARKEEREAARSEVQAAEARLRRARAGQLEVKLRQQEVEAARSQVGHAEAALLAASEQAKLTRSGPRSEEVATARARVREATAALLQARSWTSQLAVRESEQHAAQANVASAAARARAAQARVGDFHLVAGFDGVIARRYVDPGETVMPNMPVFLLIDPRRRWIAAELDAEDLGKTHEGQQVTVTAESFPGRSWPGRVRELAAVAEPKPGGRTRARIVRAKIDLLQPAPELKPGLEVDLRSGTTLRDGTLLLPNDAVLSENGGAFVMVAERRAEQTLAQRVWKSDGIARRRKVKVGAHTESQTEILEGVHEGDYVIVKGKENLADGARVRILP